MKELEQLRYLRFKGRFSQDQIAAVAKISQSEISRAERGFIKLGPEVKKRIALFFGRKPEELFPE